MPVAHQNDDLFEVLRAGHCGFSRERHAAQSTRIYSWRIGIAGQRMAFH